MRGFSEKENKVLRAIADTFVPAIKAEGRHPKGFWERCGSEVVYPEDYAEALAGNSPVIQQEFHSLLRLLNSRFLGLTWGGPFKSFCELNAEQREVLLVHWSQHKRNLLRKGFSSLKQLTLFLYYTKATEGRNPSWKAIGYPGPIHDLRPPTRNRLATFLPEPTELELSTEILVIGSGAGGGVVAARLAKAGHEVLVVEKGPYLDQPDFNQLESDMISQLYEAKGLLASASGSVSVFAGSCLGGGTTVNWAGAFETPDEILHEWATEHQLPGFIGAELQASMSRVADRIGVNEQYPYHNQQNLALRIGSERLGQQVKLIPRNELGLKKEHFQGIGYSGYGDRYGHKQGTVQTFLRDAVDHHARVLSNVRIDRITHKGNQVTGAIGLLSRNGNPQTINIKAKKVVVSAGAIHTPVLLRKSGLRHEEIGKNLFLHPTVSVTGVYAKVADPPWYGPMMSVVNDQFTKLDGNFGFKLETPPAHAGLTVLATPWVGGDLHKQMLLRMARFGHFIVLTRDRFGGSVAVDKHGFPRIKYPLAEYDLRHMLRGIQEAGRIHAAAGAEEVIFPHGTYKTVKPKMGAETLEVFLQGIHKWGWEPNKFPLFSAHQMGTARMGGNVKAHPVQPNGETREVNGLYVADASVFPSASGVNPMLTIMALADYIAGEML